MLPVRLQIHRLFLAHSPVKEKDNKRRRPWLLWQILLRFAVIIPEIQGGVKIPGKGKADHPEAGPIRWRRKHPLYFSANRRHPLDNKENWRIYFQD
jgi:hypothetical protein